MVEMGPEFGRAESFGGGWNPERGPRPGSSIEDMDAEDVARTVERAYEDPGSLSLGDWEALKYWHPELF